jgi:ABC-2 type transport system ATP-binding protein
MLCDRVCILRLGEVVIAGAIDDLLGRDARRSEVALGGADEALKSALASRGHTSRTMGEFLVVDVESDAAVRDVIERAFAGGARVESVTPKRESLEDIFVRRAI